MGSNHILMFFRRNDLKAEFSSATSGMLIESMCLVH